MSSTTASAVDADVLIIGAGPAGLSLASFLSYYGVKGMIVSNSSSTANTPRAHITNLATMETFRDIGLEQLVEQSGFPEKVLGVNSRWCDTFVGREITRTHAFGNEPSQQGDMWEASPTQYIDICQSELEPILLKYATHGGWTCRFNTEFVSLEEHADGYVVTRLRDMILNVEYTVKSKYVAGADGGKSKVVKQLGLPMVDKGAGHTQMALNLHFKADLTDAMRGRDGLLHFCFAPGIEHPPWATMAFVRAIRPWNEWQATLLGAVDADRFTASNEEVAFEFKKFLGVDPPDFELLSVSIWRINEQYAEKAISKGRVFCLGDAIHRHPPANGLGSNTSVQDAYNLAWKLAYVLHGAAGPNLLASYDVERQPVAKQVVTASNDTVRLMVEPFMMLGVRAGPEERKQLFDEVLAGRTPEAREKRKRFHAMRKTVFPFEHSAMGGEMNQFYQGEGAATYASDQSAPPEYGRDKRLYYKESTYPGFRLPHAWLSKKRDADWKSTQDLAGKGRFSILTGIGGKEKWSAAAAAVEVSLKEMNGGHDVKIPVFSIGYGQDFEDLYGQWESKREVEESGAVLVRPDRYVGWRYNVADEESAEELTGTLEQAVKKCLGF